MYANKLWEVLYPLNSSGLSQVVPAVRSPPTLSFLVSERRLIAAHPFLKLEQPRLELTPLQSFRRNTSRDTDDSSELGARIYLLGPL